MNKEFIPYEQAIALKELGFDEPCCGYYDNTIKKLDTISSEVCERLCKHDTHIKAPLYQQAFRWFREKYSLLVTIQAVMKDSWLLTIQSTDSTTANGVYNGKRWELDNDEGYVEPKSYEEAELKCLKQLIKIVKAKQR